MSETEISGRLITYWTCLCGKEHETPFSYLDSNVFMANYIIRVHTNCDRCGSEVIVTG